MWAGRRSLGKWRVRGKLNPITRGVWRGGFSERGKAGNFIRIMARILIVLMCLWSSAAIAQTFPDYDSIYVNDYADLLDTEAEAELAGMLTTLRRDAGVEMTVLTLATQAAYAPDLSLEDFATALFNRWGVGDANRNDGVLVMVIRDDRAMRVELGAGFARDWDRAAERVVDQYFLPAFRAGDYQRGIMAGSQGVIDDIVTPFLSGASAPKTGLLEYILIGGFLSVFGLFAGRFIFRDVFARFGKCPQCGQRTLSVSRVTLTPATPYVSGKGERRISCRTCDYQMVTPYLIPHFSKSSGGGGGFGGGRSGGGGASGRW